eukprot:scaffold79834_cov18-Tisochrysis_lutea.AAC.3
MGRPPWPRHALHGPMRVWLCVRCGSRVQIRRVQAQREVHTILVSISIAVHGLSPWRLTSLWVTLVLAQPWPYIRKALMGVYREVWMAVAFVTWTTWRWCRHCCRVGWHGCRRVGEGWYARVQDAAIVGEPAWLVHAWQWNTVCARLLLLLL